MGLDCYWQLPADEAVTFDPEPDLVGGVFSGQGRGSFRGKVYENFVMDETEYSLYQDLDNDQVAEIATRLARTEWDDSIPEEYRHPQDEAEFLDLVRLFQAYAQAGASMVAWY